LFSLQLYSINSELHLLLRKIYIREGKEAFGARQLELYTEESPIRQTNRR